MTGKIAKYFWSLNDRALAETAAIFKEPDHPQFVEKAVTLMSRCDEPAELFSIIPRDAFIERWPDIKRQWKKSGKAPDYLTWWDAIHQNLAADESDLYAKMVMRAPSGHLGFLGAQIRKARRKKGWSQTELARRIGVGQKEISAIENGKSNMTVATLFKLSRALGVKKIDLGLRG